MRTVAHALVITLLLATAGLAQDADSSPPGQDATNAASQDAPRKKKAVTTKRQAARKTTKAKRASKRKADTKPREKTQKTRSKSKRGVTLEATLRAAVESYIKAFNQNDAKALAEHWSTNGVYTDTASGESTRGRDKIRAEFEQMFAESKGAKLQVTIKSMRQVTDSVVVQEGTARVLAGGELSESDYSVIYVKQKSGWKIDSVRELSSPAAKVQSNNYERLKEIAWMIGEWEDQSETTTVITRCEWTKNRNFMTRSFKVVSEGVLELEGTQVIGWDPVAQRIRSWMFDSEGGFGQGTWKRDGDLWTVSSRQTMADGSTGSSVNVFRYLDDNRFTWKSYGREVNGERQASLNETVIVRKPNNE